MRWDNGHCFERDGLYRHCFERMGYIGIVFSEDQGFSWRMRCVNIFVCEARKRSHHTEHLRLDHTVTFLALRKRIDTADLSTCPWRSFEPFCVWIKFQNATNHSVLDLCLLVWLQVWRCIARAKSLRWQRRAL